VPDKESQPIPQLQQLYGSALKEPQHLVEGPVFKHDLDDVFNRPQLIRHRLTSVSLDFYQCRRALVSYQALPSLLCFAGDCPAAKFNQNGQCRGEVVQGARLA
jgi:hypothetical protein